MTSLLQRARLLWRFYQPFAIFSAIVAGVGCYDVWQQGYPAFAVLFWMKLATLGLAFYYGNYSRRHQYYYYQNLGLSRRALWALPMSVDFVLFFVLLTQTARLR